MLYTPLQIDAGEKIASLFASITFTMSINKLSIF